VETPDLALDRRARRCSPALVRPAPSRRARWLKVGTALIVLYVLSPIDLVPDFIPLLGVMDDVVLVPLAIRFLLKRLPAELAQATAPR
jgi:uncharacterized membrane protein YkvA (DUF1232 family)